MARQLSQRTLTLKEWPNEARCSAPSTAPPEQPEPHVTQRDTATFRSSSGRVVALAGENGVFSGVVGARESFSQSSAHASEGRGSSRCSTAFTVALTGGSERASE
jgi:hypothetical protein